MNLTHRYPPPDDASDDTSSDVSGEFDPKWLDKDWLEKQSKEELTELVMRLATRAQPQDSKSTLQIASITSNIPFKKLADTAELLNSDSLTFKPLPAKPPNDRPAIAYKIVLISANEQYDPLALVIQGDVTVGRQTGSSRPTLDVTPQGGEMLGVSREHAMLRPTSDALLIYDLDSTNGTYLNETIVRMGNPLPIKNNDVLSFGKLHFKVRILERPKQSD